VNGLYLLSETTDLTVAINQAKFVVAVVLMLAGVFVALACQHVARGEPCAVYEWPRTIFGRYNPIVGRVLRILVDFGIVLFIIYLPSIYPWVLRLVLR
jgi:hypothetical protein